MNNYEEIALAMYQEHAAQARQHEDHREKLTNLILVVAGALLAFVTSQSDWEARHLLLTVPVIFLGVFGAFVSLKHFERNRMHIRIAEEFRTELERSSGLPIGELHKIGHARHRLQFRWSPKWRLYRMWLGIPIAVALVGALLSCVIILQECGVALKDLVSVRRPTDKPMPAPEAPCGSTYVIDQSD